MTPLLEARDLAYTYPGEVRALGGVDFEVAPGDLVGVLGPNGAGKSTLLKLLGGLLRPDRGAVCLGDERLSCLVPLSAFAPKARARRIAIVPQALVGLPEVTVRDPFTGTIVGYQTLRVVTKDGRRITGVRRNEDTFSIQLLDQREEIHMFLKKELREVIYEKRSLMPEYTEQILSDKELQNLLAYLDGLR